MNNVRRFTSFDKSHRTKNHWRTAITAAVNVIHKNPTGGGKSEPSSMMTLASKKKAADSIHETDLIFKFAFLPLFCSLTSIQLEGRIPMDRLITQANALAVLRSES